MRFTAICLHWSVRSSGPAQSEKYQALARSKGAKGIQFYGICCSGLSSMYRYAGVIPLSNAVTAELVLGTGALDLWVADVQDVFPAIMDVARCFKTTVVTTSDSTACLVQSTLPMTTITPILGRPRKLQSVL